MRSARFRFVSSVVVAMAMVSLTAPAARAGAPPTPGEYSPPVDAPIADPFRPPAHPFGPGNRGIEYATVPGTEVRAIGAGEVTFAGQVGGTLHVTVLHADGLRSTLSYLDRIDVRRGGSVDAGQALGAAGARTHLGVRSGDEYLDPAGLFTGDRGQVRLVPTQTARSSSVAAERAAVARWLAGRPGVREQSADWLRGRALEAASIASFLSGPLDPTGFAVGTGLELFDRLTGRSPCTPSSQPVRVPPERRLVILVGGLGSTSSDAAVDRVDVVTLGYDPADVYRFSYGGGRVPDSTDRARQLAASAYDTQDSQADLEVSGEQLQELIEQLSQFEPGVRIDIVAHSQGGLVARLALDDLSEAGRTDLLGEVVTIGSPHQGADLATAAAAVRSDSGASGVFDAVDDAVGGGVDLDSASMRQLAVGSSLTDRLSRSGVPADVGVTSIGARGDLVVAANRTHLDGATNVTTALVGLAAHDALPSDRATTREIGLAIAGSPPTCESDGDIVLDVVGGRLVSHTEQLLAAGIFVGGLGVPG